MQGYYGNMAYSDAMLAEVLKTLDELGLREKTLVVDTSDHGEMLDEHRLWGERAFLRLLRARATHHEAAWSDPGREGKQGAGGVH